MGHCHSHLWMENPPDFTGMAVKNRIKGRQRYLLCHDMRRKHRKRGQICQETVFKERPLF